MVWLSFVKGPVMLTSMLTRHAQEVQLANASSSKRKAERELDEQRELVTTYEKEITQLRGQLRRIMTSLNSGEVC